ncbi:hypothetical protein TrLO_g9052 [Triparma laevis f. longispina]|uniref:Branched-chain-amino-acid transaminase n=1 Tax=Triparma laevis f. longispina TaxID=1714387 RepID=A0A9W7L0Q9_9STRA|nr:hypothetical protein TrLO_g9052 [Triparma laevis f. longispina]
MRSFFTLVALFCALDASIAFTLTKPVPFNRAMSIRAAAADCPLPGTAKLDVDWQDLGFEFRPTKSHLKVEYKNGAWGSPELVSEPYIKLHIGATALHYGQACFEGLKAYAHEDNSVHMFRPDENAKRLRSSCERTMMPVIPEELFKECAREVVKDNMAYVPPYGSNGAMYLRPLLFGSGARVGLQPADEYTFLIMVMPVGDYYKDGLAPIPALVIEDYDRAAPRGVGNVKVAGNYVADLLPNMEGKKKGFPIGLYLDSSTQTTIEEFSTSNFIGINKRQNKYVTPKSSSVLPSITNKSLMALAADSGWKVEQREIPVEELKEFEEVIACGTAVVVTPIGKVVRGDDVYNFGDGKTVGGTTMELYKRMRAIQNGEEEDKFGWNVQVC